MDHFRLISTWQVLCLTNLGLNTRGVLMEHPSTAKFPALNNILSGVLSKIAKGELELIVIPPRVELNHNPQMIELMMMFPESHWMEALDRTPTPEYWNYLRDVNWIKVAKPMQVMIDLNIRATKFQGDPYAMVQRQAEIQLEKAL